MKRYHVSTTPSPRCKRPYVAKSTVASKIRVRTKNKTSRSKSSKKKERRLEAQAHFFTQATRHFSFTPTVDVFVSDTNKQVEKFWSRLPSGPGAAAVDALS